MRRLSELQWEAKERGLAYPATATKEELMDILAAYYLIDRSRGGYQCLKQLPVMLARNTKDLPDVTREVILEGSGWIAEEKLDGVRAKLHLGLTSNRIDSRHRSDITYEFVEKTECLPHLRNLDGSRFAGTILDGELLMPEMLIKIGKTQTDSYLTATTATVNSSPDRALQIQRTVGFCSFFMFDIPFYQGTDIRNEPYALRYKLLEEVFEHLRVTASWGRGVYLPVRCTSGLSVFSEKLIAAGAEGVMLKRLDWPYESGKRSKGMYKLKKQKDIDCFVTGFVPGTGEFSGLVGALLVSIYESGQICEIGAVQPGDLAFRRSISMPGSGELAANMYGKVVEVSYMCKTKNNRRRHAVLKRFRPDKTADDCVEKGEV